MPTYEYECKDCGIRFEKVEPITAKPSRKCVDCGGSVFRVIQPVLISFKGSGFHVTDYGRGNNGRKKKGDDAGESKEKTTSESRGKSKAPIDID